MIKLDMDKEKMNTLCDKKEEEDEFEGFTLSEVKAGEKKLEAYKRQEKKKALQTSQDVPAEILPGAQGKLKQKSYSKVTQEELASLTETPGVHQDGQKVKLKGKRIFEQRNKPKKFRLDYKHGIHDETKYKKSDMDMAKFLLEKAKQASKLQEQAKARRLAAIKNPTPIQRREFVLPTQSSRSSRVIKPNKRFLEDDSLHMIVKKPKSEEESAESSPSRPKNGSPAISRQISVDVLTSPISPPNINNSGLLDQPLIVDGKRDRKPSLRLQLSDSELSIFSPPKSTMVHPLAAPKLGTGLFQQSQFQKASEKQKLSMMGFGSSRLHGASIVQKAKLQLNRAALNKSKAALARSLKAEMKREAKFAAQAKQQGVEVSPAATKVISGTEKRVYRKQQCAVCGKRQDLSRHYEIIACSSCHRFYREIKGLIATGAFVKPTCRKSDLCKLLPGEPKCRLCRIRKVLQVGFPPLPALTKLFKKEKWKTEKVEPEEDLQSTDFSPSRKDGKKTFVLPSSHIGIEPRGNFSTPPLVTPVTPIRDASERSENEQELSPMKGGEGSEKRQKKKKAFKELLRNKQEKAEEPLLGLRDKPVVTVEPEIPPIATGSVEISPQGGSGPRIKHVCRNATVVLGQPLATFPEKTELRLSALPTKDKVQLWKKDEESKAASADSDDDLPMDEIIQQSSDSVVIVKKSPSKAKTGKKLTGAGGLHLYKRKMRCRKCPGCTRPDCGKCRHCLDMKKFGGPGTMKQRCQLRKCSNPIIKRSATEAFIVEKKKADSETRGRVVQRGPDADGENPLAGMGEGYGDLEGIIPGTEFKQTVSGLETQAGTLLDDQTQSDNNNSAKLGANVNLLSNIRDSNSGAVSSLSTRSQGTEVRRLTFEDLPNFQLERISSRNRQPGKIPSKLMKKLDLEQSYLKKQGGNDGQCFPVQLQSVLPASRQWGSLLSQPRYYPIKVDFKGQCDINSAWKYGLALTMSTAMSVRALCFLCGSAGKHELIYCNICCEPFHEFCLEDWEQPAPDHYNDWICAACQFCHVCGRQNNLLQCDKCQNTYHPGCLGPNYPTKPSKSKKIWICTKCVKCKSCGATTPGSGAQATWTYDFSLCYDCGQLMDKGNFCPICHKCYKDDDWESKMIQCNKCESWVHSKCEGLTDEMYEILSFLPEDLSFYCRKCFPVGCPEWESTLKRELIQGLESILHALIISKSAAYILKYEKKECLSQHAENLVDTSPEKEGDVENLTENTETNNKVQNQTGCDIEALSNLCDSNHSRNSKPGLKSGEQSKNNDDQTMDCSQNVTPYVSNKELNNIEVLNNKKPETKLSFSDTKLPRDQSCDNVSLCKIQMSDMLLVSLTNGHIDSEKSDDDDANIDACDKIICDPDSVQESTDKVRLDGKLKTCCEGQLVLNCKDTAGNCEDILSRNTVDEQTCDRKSESTTQNVMDTGGKYVLTSGSALYNNKLECSAAGGDANQSVLVTRAEGMAKESLKEDGSTHKTVVSELNSLENAKKSAQTLGELVSRRKHVHFSDIDKQEVIGSNVPKKVENNHPKDLMEITMKMKTGDYKSVAVFCEDVLRIIQNYLDDEAEMRASRKKAIQTARSIFVKQLEKIFPWFNVKTCRHWYSMSSLPEGMLQDATLPPSTDHTYAQWLERIEPPRSPQPSPFKKKSATPVKKIMPIDDEDYDIGQLFEGDDERKCMLCHTFGDQDGNDAGRLLYCGQDDWCHINCALWSAEVYEDAEGSLQNMVEAFSRGKQLKCDLCGKPGATVGCNTKGCKANYHFMCARRDQCRFQEDKKVFCYDHRMLIDGELLPADRFIVLRRVYVGSLNVRSTKKRWAHGLHSGDISVLMGSCCVESLGRLTDLSDNPKYLQPVDFIATRMYWSTRDARRRCVYTCRIIEVRPEALKSPAITIKDMTIIHDPSHPDYVPLASLDLSSINLPSIVAAENENPVVDLTTETRDTSETVSADLTMETFNDNDQTSQCFINQTVRSEVDSQATDVQRRSSFSGLPSATSGEHVKLDSLSLSWPLSKPLKPVNHQTLHTNLSFLSPKTLKMLNIKDPSKYITPVQTDIETDEEFSLLKVAERLNQAAAKSSRRKSEESSHLATRSEGNSPLPHRFHSRSPSVERGSSPLLCRPFSPIVSTRQRAQSVDTAAESGTVNQSGNTETRFSAMLSRIPDRPFSPPYRMLQKAKSLSVEKESILAKSIPTTSSQTDKEAPFLPDVQRSSPQFTRRGRSVSDPLDLVPKPVSFSSPVVRKINDCALESKKMDFLDVSAGSSENSELNMETESSLPSSFVKTDSENTSSRNQNATSDSFTTGYLETETENNNEEMQTESKVTGTEETTQEMSNQSIESENVSALEASETIVVMTESGESLSEEEAMKIVQDLIEQRSSSFEESEQTAGNIVLQEHETEDNNDGIEASCKVKDVECIDLDCNESSNDAELPVNDTEKVSANDDIPFIPVIVEETTKCERVRRDTSEINAEMDAENSEICENMEEQCELRKTDCFSSDNNTVDLTREIESDRKVIVLAADSEDESEADIIDITESVVKAAQNTCTQSISDTDSSKLIERSFKNGLIDKMKENMDKLVEEVKDTQVEESDIKILPSISQNVSLEENKQDLNFKPAVEVDCVSESDVTKVITEKIIMYTSSDEIDGDHCKVVEIIHSGSSDSKAEYEIKQTNQASGEFGGFENTPENQLLHRTEQTLLDRAEDTNYLESRTEVNQTENDNSSQSTKTAVMRGLGLGTCDEVEKLKNSPQKSPTLHVLPPIIGNRSPKLPTLSPYKSYPKRKHTISPARYRDSVEVYFKKAVSPNSQEKSSSLMSEMTEENSDQWEIPVLQSQTFFGEETNEVPNKDVSPELPVLDPIAKRIKEESIAKSCPSEKGPFKCDKCRRMYRTESSYNTHIENCNFLVSSSDDEEENNINENNDILNFTPRKTRSSLLRSRELSMEDERGEISDEHNVSDLEEQGKRVSLRKSTQNQRLALEVEERRLKDEEPQKRGRGRPPLKRESLMSEQEKHLAHTSHSNVEPLQGQIIKNRKSKSKSQSEVLFSDSTDDVIEETFSARLTRRKSKEANLSQSSDSEDEGEKVKSENAVRKRGRPRKSEIKENSENKSNSEDGSLRSPVIKRRLRSKINDAEEMDVTDNAEEMAANVTDESDFESNDTNSDLKQQVTCVRNARHRPARMRFIRRKGKLMRVYVRDSKPDSSIFKSFGLKPLSVMLDKVHCNNKIVCDKNRSEKKDTKKPDIDETPKRRRGRPPLKKKSSSQTVTKDDIDEKEKQSSSSEDEEGSILDPETGWIVDKKTGKVIRSPTEKKEDNEKDKLNNDDIMNEETAVKLKGENEEPKKPEEFKDEKIDKSENVKEKNSTDSKSLNCDITLENVSACSTDEERIKSDSLLDGESSNKSKVQGNLTLENREMRSYVEKSKTGTVAQSSEGTGDIVDTSSGTYVKDMQENVGNVTTKQLNDPVKYSPNISVSLTSAANEINAGTEQTAIKAMQLSEDLPRAVLQLLKDGHKVVIKNPKSNQCFLWQKTPDGYIGKPFDKKLLKKSSDSKKEGAKPHQNEPNSEEKEQTFSSPKTDEVPKTAFQILQQKQKLEMQKAEETGKEQHSKPVDDIRGDISYLQKKSENLVENIGTPIQTNKEQKAASNVPRKVVPRLAEYVGGIMISPQLSSEEARHTIQSTLPVAASVLQRTILPKAFNVIATVPNTQIVQSQLTSSFVQTSFPVMQPVQTGFQFISQAAVQGMQPLGIQTISQANLQTLTQTSYGTYSDAGFQALSPPSQHLIPTIIQQPCQQTISLQPVQNVAAVGIRMINVPVMTSAAVSHAQVISPGNHQQVMSLGNQQQVIGGSHQVIALGNQQHIMVQQQSSPQGQQQILIGNQQQTVQLSNGQKTLHEFQASLQYLNARARNQSDQSSADGSQSSQSISFALPRPIYNHTHIVNKQKHTVQQRPMLTKALLSMNDPILSKVNQTSSEKMDQSGQEAVNNNNSSKLMQSYPEMQSLLQSDSANTSMDVDDETSAVTQNTTGDRTAHHYFKITKGLGGGTISLLKKMQSYMASRQKALVVGKRHIPFKPKVGKPISLKADKSNGVVQYKYNSGLRRRTVVTPDQNFNQENKSVSDGKEIVTWFPSKDLPKRDSLKRIKTPQKLTKRPYRKKKPVEIAVPHKSDAYSHPMIHPQKEATSLPVAAAEEEVRDVPLSAHEDREGGQAGINGTAPNLGHLEYEITSDDGYTCRADSLDGAWKQVTEKVQDARTASRQKHLSYAGLSGLQMFGLSHPNVMYLVEQLYGASYCHRYKFKYHKHELIEREVELVNPTGCIRTEPFCGRNPWDMFSFLMSRYRKLPEYTGMEVNEEMSIKSSRRATSMDLPMAMRFRKLKEFSKECVGVYRSTIHGRGLFCKRNIDAGEMIIEYAGEVIRNSLTDHREKYYESKGIGCYMFRIDDIDVVDATMKGSAARFINHSCDPNCYSKVITVDNRKHIVIFAMKKILRGEELTYDYKFPIEEIKIPCTCGSKRCRRYLN